MQISENTTVKCSDKSCPGDTIYLLVSLPMTYKTFHLQKAKLGCIEQKFEKWKIIPFNSLGMLFSEHTE